MNETNRNLFLKAMNRLRRQWFSDDEMKLFEMTPETGETEIDAVPENWSGRRVESETDSASNGTFWQFQIAANDDWVTSQAFMNRVVAIKIGTRRFKVPKVQKPFGKSLVWKLKAEIQ